MLTVKLSVTEKHIIVSLDVQLRIHHWLKSNRLLWLAIPSYLIIFFLSTPLSAILRSGKTEAVRRDYFCPQLISPPTSSKIDVTPSATAEVHQFDTCCSTNKGMNIPEFARHGFSTWTSRTFDNLKKRGRCNSASCKRPLKLTDDKLRESFATCERHWTFNIH